MDENENANPNPEASTSINAAPTYYPPAYVVPYTDPAYYPPTYVLLYVPYALYTATLMVATHYSPVRYIYATVSSNDVIFRSRSKYCL